MSIDSHLSDIAFEFDSLTFRKCVRISVGAVLVLAVFKILCRVYSALSSPLRDAPGPFMARFTRLWKLSAIYGGRFEEINVQLHQKYGPIVRIAPNEYSIDDPDAVSIIYGLGGDFAKSPWYTASGDPNPHNPPDLFSDRNPKTHAASRRLVANLYSMTTLVKLEPYINECSEIIKEKFNKFAVMGQSIDMGHWMQCYAFDVIGSITVGKRFGFLDEGIDIRGIMAAISQYLFYASHVGVYSEWHRTASRIWPYIFAGGEGLAAMGEFTQARVAEALAEDESVSKDQGTFLARLMTQHKADPEKITMMTVIKTCGTNIGAGSDTTSISLSSVLYHLCRNPHSLQALRDEIDAKESTQEISNPVTFQEAQKMPYLQAVIKEALRLHPATGLPLGRVVPKGGKLIAGRIFPEGAIVGINTWVAHANEDVFGSDASVFRPERWLDNAERSKMQDKYFFTFGMGSRTCIGKNISLLEISKLIPQLIRDFDFELEDPGKGWSTKSAWFVKQYDFRCKVRRRSRDL